jgi:hypothetical protein
MRILRILFLSFALFALSISASSPQHPLTETVTAATDVCHEIAAPVFNACMASQVYTSQQCYMQYVSVYESCAPCVLKQC